MTIKPLLLKQTLLLCTFLFSLPCPGSTVDPRTCGSRVFRMSFDKNQGADDLAALVAMNHWLEQARSEGSLSEQQIFERGLAVYRSEEVTDKSNQVQPYVRLDLPLAKTGVYVPKKRELSQFDALAIFLPGIGFSVSTAKSLFPIAGTFNNGNGKKTPGLIVEGFDKPLKVLSFAMDAPLNGMAESAPYSFGHPDGVMAVMRHAQLILTTLFPGKKVIWAGRSQGGLNALEYGTRYSDVALVIGLNPSIPNKKIIDYCIDYHEDVEQAAKDGLDIHFHTRSWSAHADYTPIYSVLDQRLKVPGLLLLGKQDHTYTPPPDRARPGLPSYRALWKHWANQQSMATSVSEFEGGHNLWNRPHRSADAGLFVSTVRAMTESIRSSLK